MLVVVVEAFEQAGEDERAAEEQRHDPDLLDDDGSEDREVYDVQQEDGNQKGDVGAFPEFLSAFHVVGVCAFESVLNQAYILFQDEVLEENRPEVREVEPFEVFSPVESQAGAEPTEGRLRAFAQSVEREGLG